MLEHGALTEAIIGAAIEVHRRLGPGFLESVYENALVIELRKRALSVEQQVPVALHYDGQCIGQHRIDVFVERTIVLELKAVKAFETIHFAVVRSYLRAVERRHGLLLNFNAMPLGVRRVIVDVPDAARS